MSKKSWIKELRLKKGLTQGQAAALLSVSDRTWRRWEKDNPSLMVEIAIKSALKT